MEVFMKVLLTAINAKYIHSNLSVLLFMEYFICGAADHRDSQSAAKDADLAWRAGSVLQCSFCDGAISTGDRCHVWGRRRDLSGTDGILESGEGKSGYDQGYRIPGEWNLPAEPAAPGHGSE